MKKTLLFLTVLLCSLCIHAQTEIPIHIKKGPVTPGTPNRSPILFPSVFLSEENNLFVTYPYTTVMTVSVSQTDGSFYTEQTFYAVSTASISGLDAGTYTLTVTVGDIVYEGEFEVEFEVEEE